MRHTIIFFTALIAMGFGCLTSSAKKSWHLITDTDQAIPVASIEYIIENPTSGGFDVVINHDNIVYQGVVKSTFEFREESGVGQIESNKESVIGPYGGVITIRGMRAGGLLSVYNSVGALVLSRVVAPGERAITLDVSSLTPGLYVLNTSNSTVKFVKR